MSKSRSIGEKRSVFAFFVFFYIFLVNIFCLDFQFFFNTKLVHTCKFEGNYSVDEKNLCRFDAG